MKVARGLFKYPKNLKWRYRGGIAKSAKQEILFRQRLTREAIIPPMLMLQI